MAFATIHSAARFVKTGFNVRSLETVKKKPHDKVTEFILINWVGTVSSAMCFASYATCSDE